MVAKPYLGSRVYIFEYTTFLFDPHFQYTTLRFDPQVYGPLWVGARFGWARGSCAPRRRATPCHHATHGIKKRCHNSHNWQKRTSTVPVHNPHRNDDLARARELPRRLVLSRKVTLTLSSLMRLKVELLAGEKKRPAWLLYVSPVGCMKWLSFI